MKCSVALCTYNGADYIKEQLCSFLNQTLSIDEVVVCDDGSSDDTLQIIERIGTKTTIPIRVYRNDSNLGPSRNFQKAVGLCSGDIIFLADQDDVWHSNKVALVVRYFETHPDKQVVFTDGDLIDNTGGRVSENGLWDYVGMTATAQHHIDQGWGIELFAAANRATGATMAVRRTFPFLHSFAHFTNDIILHDYAIALLALKGDQLGYLPERTVDYRIHPNQQMGIRDYFATPMDDSLFHTNHDTVVIQSLGFPEPIASRVGFALKRDRNRHKAMGVFGIIGSFKQYKPLYGETGRRIALDDLRQWLRHQWHRLFQSLSKTP